MKTLLSSLLLVAASSFFGPNLLCAAPTNARPNVLMIAIDDLNDYISVLQNHPGIKTPNFDRLAARGINFTRAYCTAPLCNPSRVASGHRHGTASDRRISVGRFNVEIGSRDGRNWAGGTI